MVRTPAATRGVLLELRQQVPRWPDETLEGPTAGGSTVCRFHGGAELSADAWQSAARFRKSLGGIFSFARRTRRRPERKGGGILDAWQRAEKREIR